MKNKKSTVSEILLEYGTVLMIFNLEEFDYISMRGRKLTNIFIPRKYKDTKLVKEFENQIQPNIIFLGKRIGEIYYYEK